MKQASVAVLALACRRMRRLLFVFLFLSSWVVMAQQEQPGDEIITVRYGYFTETRPLHAACARRWFDLRSLSSSGSAARYYRVECYPQPSGNFAASRLDNGHLDLANLGSTPLAQGTRHMQRKREKEREIHCPCAWLLCT